MTDSSNANTLSSWRPSLSPNDTTDSICSPDRIDLRLPWRTEQPPLMSTAGPRQTLQRSAPVDARTTSPPSFRFSFLVSRRSISPPRLPSLSRSEDLGSGWQRDASMIRWSELPPRDVDESRTTVVDYWRRRVSMILVE